MQADFFCTLPRAVAVVYFVRLQLLDLTLPTPAENLACDEALLNDCAARGGEVLRFWESPVPFVVVGYANEVMREAKVAACDADGVAIGRRCSGGGTVLQGPGCLNYALVLDLSANAELLSVTGTNTFILNRQAQALMTLLGSPVKLLGDTDLVWNGCKFSGNAQRRGRTHLLFHGTVLLDFDFKLLEKYLPSLPPRQPAYRLARSHREFLVNLPLAAGAVKRALAAAWQAEVHYQPWPREETQRLVRDRYGLAEWNRSR